MLSAFVYLMQLCDSGLDHFRVSCLLPLAWQRTKKDTVFILRLNLFFMQGNLGCYGHTQVEYSNGIRILILCISFDYTRKFEFITGRFFRKF